ncbi:MAG: GNAT family N-acetyltransferase [Acetatifactor sp.]|nr:GNAT family N-acetyltransferase [Acetatifactor sp.]
MNKRLCEESEWLLTKDAYDIYKQCLYKKSYEDYKGIINAYMGNENMKIYCCEAEDKKAGIIALSVSEAGKAEILGIAVCDHLKKCGIGTFMIRESAKALNLKRIIAETDDDAVAFYKAMEFSITKEIKQYDNGAVARYHCVRSL